MGSLAFVFEVLFKEAMKKVSSQSSSSVTRNLGRFLVERNPVTIEEEERDELRGTLCNSICNVSLYTKRAQPYLLGSDMSDVLDKTADNLLSAGYRKTRTITTVEELDALAVGSVVLCRGRAFQHYPAYPAPFDEYQKWKCADGGFVRSTKDGSMILPAMVIHEPMP